MVVVWLQTQVEGKTAEGVVEDAVAGKVGEAVVAGVVEGNVSEDAVEGWNRAGSGGGLVTDAGRGQNCRGRVGGSGSWMWSCAALCAGLVTRCAAALRAGLRRVMELRCVHVQLPLGAAAVREVCGKAVGLRGACRVARCPGDEAMQQRCVRGRCCCGPCQQWWWPGWSSGRGVFCLPHVL